MLLLRRIVGDSMSPTLSQGQLVVGLRFLRIHPGDVVVVHHDGLEKVKRIERLQGGRVFLVGDNLHGSTDSRSFGWLSQKAVVARIIWPRISRSA